VQLLEVAKKRQGTNEVIIREVKKIQEGKASQRGADLAS
jgi:hypothetical protein